MENVNPYNMKTHLILKVLTFSIILLFSCKKDNLSIDDKENVLGEVQLNTLFNIKEIKQGFIISGVNNSKFTLLKLDIDFKTIWKKDNYQWGNNYSDGGWGGSFYSVGLVNIFQDEQEDFVCFCSVMEGGDVIWNSVLIVTLDKFGNEIKRSKLEDYSLINVTKTIDNGYLLFGNNLTKLNSDLSIAWENDDQNYCFSGANISATYDKGFAITGTWNSDQVFLQKLDKNGVIQWTKKDYNTSPFNDLGFDVCQVAMDGFLIVGRTRVTKEPWDMNCFLIRTDNKGDTIWTRKFGVESNEWLDKLLFTSEDDFIIKEKVGFPNDPLEKTILVRITGNGQILESKEVGEFEKLLYTASGYFVKVQKTENNIMTLSKVKRSDLFEN